MKRNRKLTICAVLIGVFFTYWGCENNVSPGLEESFNVIQEVSSISGAESVSMNLQTVQRSNVNLTVDFSNIEPNNLIKNGMKEAWCIEWGTPQREGAQDEVVLYSTKGKEKWKELNHFLSIKNQLIKQDPDLTWKEIQVVIWSLVQFKPFDVDKMHEYNLTAFYNNGEYKFDVQKVKNIISNVKNGLTANKLKVSSFEAFAVVVENDGQTIIVEGEETFWAFGPDEDDHCFRENGSQWGWTYGFDHGSNENHLESTELVAGAGQDMCEATTAEETGGTIVGDVSLEKSGDNLDMTLSAIENYAFDVVHIDADCNLETLKERMINDGGNVAPGRFPIKYSDDENGEYFTEVTFSLSLSDNDLVCTEGTLHLAIHGVSVEVVE